jgi:hypothetical protein
MSQLNGEIPMEMGSGMKKMVMKRMRVQQSEERQFLTDSDAEIRMAMAGLTRQMTGRPIHTDRAIHSLLKRFNGVIQMQMVLVMSHLVQCEMIVLKYLGPRLEMYRVVKIQMMMGGQMNTVNGTPLWPLWAKIQQHLG